MADILGGKVKEQSLRTLESGKCSFPVLFTLVRSLVACVVVGKMVGAAGDGAGWGPSVIARIEQAFYSCAQPHSALRVSVTSCQECAVCDCGVCENHFRFVPLSGLDPPPSHVHPVPPHPSLVCAPRRPTPSTSPRRRRVRSPT
jgi:hypothetical protein